MFNKQFSNLFLFFIILFFPSFLYSLTCAEPNEVDNSDFIFKANSSKDIKFEFNGISFFIEKNSFVDINNRLYRGDILIGITVNPEASSSSPNNQVINLGLDNKSNLYFLHKAITLKLSARIIEKDAEFFGHKTEKKKLLKKEDKLILRDYILSNYRVSKKEKHLSEASDILSTDEEYLLDSNYAESSNRITDLLSLRKNKKIKIKFERNEDTKIFKKEVLNWEYDESNAVYIQKGKTSFNEADNTYSTFLTSTNSWKISLSQALVKLKIPLKGNYQVFAYNDNFFYKTRKNTLYLPKSSQIKIFAANLDKKLLSNLIEKKFNKDSNLENELTFNSKSNKQWRYVKIKIPFYSQENKSDTLPSLYYSFNLKNDLDDLKTIYSKFGEGAYEEELIVKKKDHVFYLYEEFGFEFLGSYRNKKAKKLYLPNTLYNYYYEFPLIEVNTTKFLDLFKRNKLENWDSIDPCS